MTQLDLFTARPPVRGLMGCCTWSDSHGLHSYGWSGWYGPSLDLWRCHGCGRMWTRETRTKEVEE